MGSSPCTKSLATQFYIAAAILILFGLGDHASGRGLTGSSSSTLWAGELCFGVAMVGAGLYLLGGEPVARIVGLCVSGATVAFGAYVLVKGIGYVPGTIVAIYALVHLWGADAAFGGPSPTTTAYPPLAQPFQAPYGSETGYPAAPVAPAPYGQNAPPSVLPPAQHDYFGGTSALPPAPPEPTRPVPPPPTDPASRPDPRFG